MDFEKIIRELCALAKSAEEMAYVYDPDASWRREMGVAPADHSEGEASAYLSDAAAARRLAARLGGLKQAAARQRAIDAEIGFLPGLAAIVAEAQD